ncbi:MAG: ATP-binding cassette domain-containing protein [Coleofasciculaceae cyanobacterium SM2_1_6]|nr:ATP-binding cassette domain-containing protein [Coleofasciculaceae cyanobacterium SM2_1_6]
MAILAAHNLTKQFPGVLANDRVNFSVEPGEVHVLLGENGAGKATLMNMLYGLIALTSIDIWVNEAIELVSGFGSSRSYQPRGENSGTGRKI